MNNTSLFLVFMFIAILNAGAVFAIAVMIRKLYSKLENTLLGIAKKAYLMTYDEIQSNNEMMVDIFTKTEKTKEND